MIKITLKKLLNKIKSTMNPSEETVIISKENALKAYRNGDQKEKILLENLIGKEIFNQKITDRVKTFEDACVIVNVNPNDSKFNSGTKDDIAYQKIKVIIQALNEGWHPDWNNSNELKWRPWFYLDQPGFRFIAAFYANSYSLVGSRLCFKSEELCVYAANQFKEIYKDLFM